MFAQAKGAKVYYEMRGDHGERVVLLHGWGCSTKLMENLANALQGDHRVLLIDFPGFGQSSRPPEPWGVPEYAECLRELLQQLHFLPCAAVGHSFGCRVATWVASQWPEMFTKLVFTGAAGLRSQPTEEGKKRSAEFQRKKAFAKRVEKIPLMRKIGEQYEAKIRKEYGSADYNALDEEMRQTFVKVINLDLRDRYPLIQQSVLLIWGDADTETPLWMGQEMEKLISDAGLVILEGGTHFAYLEQASRFNAIVHHFLTEA
ncbi:MAG: alpha/beta hydrolase [Clostridia bacterium]|nr:alpha/beta hydrolase [Clostridia bacterium]